MLALSLSVLLSASPLSAAPDRDISGTGLYKSTVSAAKSRVQPEEATVQIFDEKEALKISQAAIGKQLGDYTFLDRSGRTVRLSDYLGKPLVISMIYTHCPIICATTTRSLSAIKMSQDALGADTFGVLTIGFDTENDIPETMGDFAKRMNVNLPNWEFVSSDPDTIKKISKDLGFTYFPSEYGGYNHITQTTFIDGKGKVYLHIYGDEFDNKTLLQPLKDLIYNIQTARPGIDGLTSKVKLFCTVYDARTGKYRLDYSYFYGIGLGVLVTLLITWWLVHEYRRSPKRSLPGID
ncbi:MAG: SCO family protein [Gallionella sp.]|nr:SCO family protein [Gallionella sp.]